MLKVGVCSVFVSLLNAPGQLNCEWMLDVAAYIYHMHCIFWIKVQKEHLQCSLLNNKETLHAQIRHSLELP